MTASSCFESNIYQPKGFNNCIRMKTRILYPLSHHKGGNTKFWYLETPSSSNYNCEALGLIRKYNIFIDVELPISTNEIIRTNLRVHKKLDVNNSPITKYTIQYEDTNNNCTIRADNGHTFPHIDLQLPNKQKEKRIFDTDPEDYEASINSVLRYAEFYNNQYSGVDYWLFNITAFKADLIHSFFNTTRGHINVSTAFTDIARLAAVEIQTATEEINYGDERLARNIVNKFIRCKEYEEMYKRPLKIAKNLIQSDVDTILFPFPIFFTNEVQFVSKIYDNTGNEIPAAGSFFPLGKTTFRNN
jgi:hypothetical protein